MSDETKKTVVYMEIGENLKELLMMVINLSYQQNELIGETFDKMGFNLKDIVREAVKEEPGQTK